MAFTGSHWPDADHTEVEYLLTRGVVTVTVASLLLLRGSYQQKKQKKSRCKDERLNSQHYIGAEFDKPKVDRSNKAKQENKAERLAAGA
jgi:hypothetical protein